MRKIKFCGKRVDNGEWVYGSYILENACPKEVYMIKPDNMFNRFIRVNHCTVGQFTGLLDRNGKEIYEGDVMMNRNAKVFVIIYRGGGFCAMSPREYCLDLAGCPCTISDPLGAKQSSDYFQEQCWVIGNVHERSELLDVAEG